MSQLMQRPGNDPATAGPAAGSVAPGQDDAAKLDQAAVLLKSAVKILYNDRFDALVKMFKVSGVEGFPSAMATAINSVIDDLEKAEAVPADLAAGVGMRLFFMLLEDLIKGNVVPKVDGATIQNAIKATITMYADTHKDTVTPEDMQAFGQELQRKAGGA